MMTYKILTGIILLFAPACQPTLVTQPPLPTLMALPDPAVTVEPTQTPHPIRAAATFTPAPTSTPDTATRPAATALIKTAAPSPTSTATLTLTPLPGAFSYGRSVEGRDLLAQRFGSGEKIILLVGGIHTGYEANTVRLVEEMAAHYEAVPDDVLPGITLILIPAANPDGLQHGRDSDGRFNASGVDLNRNWGCDWSPDAVWRDHPVNPGQSAFSEPETRALAALIRDLQPAAVLFYHAAARGVFAGDCADGNVSNALAEAVGRATGYPYGQPFAKYTVTGTASNWVDGQGIPALDVELSTTTETELVRNLNGVRAAQCWLLGIICEGVSEAG